MQDFGGHRGGNDDPTRLAWQRCGEFTMALIKTLLQTGTYSLDHPLAQQASAELFGRFKLLTQDATELSYVLMSTVDDRGVMVEGLLPEPIEVGKTFRSMMGDHFVAKFHDYFLRNRIASFTIKHEIERDEFDRFLEIWVNWGLRLTQDATGAESAVRLSQEFTRHDVLRVTIIGIDEVLGGFRQLSWAVKIALSRIRKDISRLPMLKGAAPETIQALKAQAVSDIVRPITRYDLLRDILLNLDLVTDGLDYTRPDELEQAVLGALAPATVHQVALLLLDLIQTYQDRPAQFRVVGRDPKDVAESARHVLRSALLRLAPLDIPESRSLLEQCHQLDLIGFDDLPKSVQRKIRAGRTTSRFIERIDAYLADLDGATDATTYLKYTNVLVLILPELLARGRADLVGRVFEILERHEASESPFPGRQRFIRELLGALESGGFVDALIQATAATSKEVRDPLERAVAMFGETVVPGLVSVLATEQDVSARKAACSVLVRIGPPALRQLTDELRAHRHPWFTARNLIQVLAEIGSRDAIPVMIEYSAHPNPKVREECLIGLARIGGEDVDSALLRFLGDDEEPVVRRAIQQLAALRATAPEFLERLHQTIRMRTRQEDEPSESLQATCLRALLEYEKVLLPPQPDFEAALLEIVSPVRLKTLLPGRLGIRPKSDSLVLLAIEALGVRGGLHTADTLMALAGGSDTEKAQAATRALQTFMRRQQGGQV